MLTAETMQSPPTMNDRSTSDSTRRTNRRRAIAVSIGFHLVLITGLFCWYVPGPKATTDTTDLASSADTRTPITRDVPSEPPDSGTVPPSPEVPPEQIEASIESQIEAVQSLPDERKLSELEKNLARLDSIATEQSVRDVTATIASSLGLQPGPEATDLPAESNGEFDPETAQILEIRRSVDPRGGWQYTSVLVDSQGRTREVPMPGAEGETAYRTFEQLKQYPIADGIYRQLVMPMIQKMIQAGEVAEQAAKEAQRMQTESIEPTDDGNFPPEAGPPEPRP